MVMNNLLKAEYLKQFLLKIYHCKKDFELLVIDKKPKTRSGVYIVDKQRIRIYSKWICDIPLEEIAIHEYAHHIHETEKRKNENRRKEFMVPNFGVYTRLFVVKHLWLVYTMTNLLRIYFYRIKQDL